MAYLAPPEGDEAQQARSKRQDKMRQALKRGAGAVVEWAGATEKQAEAVARWKKEAARERQEVELGRPEVRGFLEDELGNLPLTVKLVGRMLAAGAGAWGRGGCGCGCGRCVGAWDRAFRSVRVEQSQMDAVWCVERLRHTRVCERACLPRRWDADACAGRTRVAGASARWAR